MKFYELETGDTFRFYSPESGFHNIYLYTDEESFVSQTGCVFKIKHIRDDVMREEVQMFNALWVVEA